MAELLGFDPTNERADAMKESAIQDYAPALSEFLLPQKRTHTYRTIPFTCQGIHRNLDVPAAWGLIGLRRIKGKNTFVLTSYD